MAPARSEEDDFVLTISDNDDLPYLEESDPEENIATDTQKSKKRKREGSKKTANKKHKTEDLAENDSESEKEQGIKDGAIDSDFEFEVDKDSHDVVEDFDGWGAPEQKYEINKGVDVAQIIERRLAAKNKPGTSSAPLKKAIGKKDAAEQDSERDLDDNDDDDDEFTDAPIDFDDEDIDPDTFGADIDSEEDEMSPVGTDTNRVHDDSDVDEDEEDDASSVASPVAHPDDLASEEASDAETEDSQSDAEEAEKRKAFFAAESDHATSSSNTNTSFQQFSISRPLLRALAALSFTTPTPIQTRTIPVALQGLDVVGSAQTGSGKTAAFLLPILERLIYRPRKVPTTRVAILMPTRELAVQCYSVATALAKFTDITFAQVVGGFSLREQEAILKKRPDVVIATPGRFIDHMRNSASFAVENLEILVLDEADRMLEQGFADELDEILKTIPRSRQTMLFSATMTDSVDKLVRVGMNKPVRVSIDAKRSTVSGLVQEFVRLRPGREELRLASLAILCSTIIDYKERTIVFFRQKKEAHRVRIIFGLLGIKAGELHGSMTQDQRIAAVNQFRDGKTTHLLATDVASRGLDIKNVLSVINYEAPQTHEIYLHRVGRTARAGRTGKACTIAAEPDRKVVKAAVKAARTQGAKIVSRVLDADQVNGMGEQIDGLADEIEEILKEEKQEKQLGQMEAEVSRGQNIVKHHDEIMGRPKRTWFESEKEKQAAKQRAKDELNGKLFKGEKKPLSNKDKKKLDLHRDRLEGRQWKKGKGDSEASGKDKKNGKSNRKAKSKATRKR